VTSGAYSASISQELEGDPLVHYKFKMASSEAQPSQPGQVKWVEYLNMRQRTSVFFNDSSVCYTLTGPAFLVQG